MGNESGKSNEYPCAVERERTVYFQRLITVYFQPGPYILRVTRLCFQMHYFQYTIPCFQYTGYVSKRLFMFPISNFCFQYPTHVSKSELCFQTTMFPMYVSNIHGALPSKIWLPGDYGRSFMW